MSATDGRQLVALALLQVLLHHPLLKAYLDLVIVESTHVQLLIALGIQEAILHV